MRWRLATFAVFVLLGATAFAPAPFPKHQKPVAEAGGKRKPLTVAINEDTVLGGPLIPGSRVDVLLMSRGADRELRTVYKNVLVFGVSTQLTDGRQYASLLLTQTQCERLIFYLGTADLRLVHCAKDAPK